MMGRQTYPFGANEIYTVPSGPPARCHCTEVVIWDCFAISTSLSGQEEVSFGRVRTKTPSGLTRFMWSLQDYTLVCMLVL